MTPEEILKKFEQFVSDEWHKIMPELKTAVIPIAVGVVEGVKFLVDSDSTDVIGSLLGKAGVAAENTVRNIVPKVLVDLRIAQNCVDKPTAEEVIACAASYLKLSGNPIRNLMYHNLAVMVAHQMAAGKLGLGEVIADVQYYYDNVTKPHAGDLSQAPASASAPTSAQ